MKTEIKICGLRRKEDIGYVNAAQADYAGFVFAPSKRRVDQELALQLIKGLDDNIQKVGVLVNMPVNEAKELRNYLKLDVLQLHGEEDNAYMEELGGRIWKALSVETKEDIQKIPDYLKYCEKVVLDSPAGKYKGGSGRSFDWALIDMDIDRKNIVLAGGLSVDNIKLALEEVKPGCVDVSSGVETDGFKDEEKIREFVRLVREYA